MKEHEGLEGAVETLERVLPRLMRRLFFDLTADSPLWELPLPQLKVLGMLERGGGAAAGPRAAGCGRRASGARLSLARAVHEHQKCPPKGRAFGKGLGLWERRTG